MHDRFCYSGRGLSLDSCHHTRFHASCLEKWLSVDSTCPLCRKSVATLNGRKIAPCSRSSLSPEVSDAEMEWVNGLTCQQCGSGDDEVRTAISPCVCGYSINIYTERVCVCTCGDGGNFGRTCSCSATAATSQCIPTAWGFLPCPQASGSVPIARARAARMARPNDKGCQVESMNSAGRPPAEPLGIVPINGCEAMSRNASTHVNVFRASLIPQTGLPLKHTSPN